MDYMCLFQFWFPQGISLGAGLLGHMVVLFLDFQESSYCLPYLLYQFSFPPTMQEHFLWPTPSPAFIVCRIFDDGHLDWCEVISHCSFDLHLSGNGNPLQGSCLENPTDRGSWQAIVYAVASIRHDLATKEREWRKGNALALLEILLNVNCYSHYGRQCGDFL